ncbi:high-affinity nickel-transport family protein [Reticulomyxa filosa]|uniref:High-affinity nickel-transport family protein n=1 Tax=Reticulomyxa filosa TaxID=46433 RepID=X6MT18_RETFI|nr:high-affinity nickel-transport family protein [Reticulomyxa filosa]|eukprot:ETO16597.1 high-affinity nickel-transport family protein [Reticulomyxa filosa]
MQMLSEYMELVVGFSLILIGVLGIQKSNRHRSKSYYALLPIQEPSKHFTFSSLESQHNTILGDNIFQYPIEPTYKKSSLPANRRSFRCYFQNLTSFIRSWTPEFCYKLKEQSESNMDSLLVNTNTTIFFTGVIHGVSGQGHILGVLPALTFTKIASGVMFLLAFCVGTLLSMSVVTMGLGYLGMKLSQTNKHLPQKLSTIASVFAIVIEHDCILHQFSTDLILEFASKSTANENPKFNETKTKYLNSIYGIYGEKN